MDIAETTAVERIARVLAAYALSRNGKGDLISAAAEVDDHWREQIDSARIVLRTLREPSHAMAAAGDAKCWAAMIDCALHEEPERR